MNPGDIEDTLDQASGHISLAISELAKLERQVPGVGTVLSLLRAASTKVGEVTR